MNTKRAEEAKEFARNLLDEYLHTSGTYNDGIKAMAALLFAKRPKELQAAFDFLKIEGADYAVIKCKAYTFDQFCAAILDDKEE